MNENKEKKNKIEITERFISLERVIASKNKNLLRVIPKFLLNWFKKLIHLEEINAGIYKYRNVIGHGFATEILDKEFGVDVEVVNKHNIPKEGRVIFVANHPLGGADGMALISEIGKVREDILFPVNDVLCNLPTLEPIFVPINKYGVNTRNHDALEEAFAGDGALLFFPAGMVSRKNKGVIRDLDWQKAFVRKAKEYERDIVPVYIDAANTKRFYRLANLRKRLGIRFNYELVLLPDEMFKQKGKKIRLVFGQSIPYQTIDKTHSFGGWAEVIKNHVYELGNNPELVYNNKE